MDWTKAKHFQRDEFLPTMDGMTDEERDLLARTDMDETLICWLDALRDEVGPIAVTKGGGMAMTGHAPESLHYPRWNDALKLYTCKAADIYLPGQVDGGWPHRWLQLGMTAWSMFRRMPCGIGLYPLDNFIHLDHRAGTGKKPAAWFREKSREYRYYSHDRFPAMVYEASVHRWEYGG